MISLFPFYQLPVNIKDPRLGAHILISKVLKRLKLGTKSVVYVPTKKVILQMLTLLKEGWADHKDANSR